MHTIALIGIGTGNPEHLTLEAVRVLNAADLVLLPRKGAAKADLAELRRTICARHLAAPGPRIVEFDLPVRDAGNDYLAGVEAWHDAIAATYRRLIEAEAAPGATIALLVWGDPSLYDSTLRILGRLEAGGLAITRQVVPGITSLQLLCARHAIPLNTVGGPVTLTTGRRLAEAVPDTDTIAVLLDGGTAFAGLEGFTIYWGAYLGMPNEILIAGPLPEVAGEIAAARAAAREANGWIMDVYLLRRRPAATA